MNKTPYQRLLEAAREYVREINTAHTVCMFFYKKADLTSKWSMTDFYERAKAAEQLGYRVEVRAEDRGLAVYYVKENPPIPREFKY